MSAFIAARTEFGEKEKAKQEQRDTDRTRGSKPDETEMHVAIRSYVSEHFNDPDVEFIDWGEPRKRGQYWVVEVRLRAKNGFGAKVLKTVNFSLQKGEVVQAQVED